MKNHRCYVCMKIEKESKLIKAVFTRDYDDKWGHRLCFDDCNKNLTQMGEPFRWKYNPPNAKITGPGDDRASTDDESHKQGEHHGHV